jgi:hypothetical protein
MKHVVFNGLSAQAPAIASLPLPSPAWPTVGKSAIPSLSNSVSRQLINHCYNDSIQQASLILKLHKCGSYRLKLGTCQKTEYTTSQACVYEF